MALYESDLSPSDGLWDLVAVAVDLAEPRLAEAGDWVQVTSERARRPDDQPMEGSLADWGNPDAQFDTQPCATLADARALASERLGPLRHWRAAVVWRDRDAVYVQAQDAESDEVAALWTYPIERRGRHPPRLDREDGPMWTEADALRPPTWNGTTWTLRADGPVVADLEVEYTWPPFLHGTLTPRDAFDDVAPVLKRYDALVDSHEGRLFWDRRPADLQAALDDVRAAVSLHAPDDAPITDFDLHAHGSRAMWTWPGAP